MTPFSRPSEPPQTETGQQRAVHAPPQNATESALEGTTSIRRGRLATQKAARAPVWQHDERRRVWIPV
jgi:hypothetical protein